MKSVPPILKIQNLVITRGTENPILAVPHLEIEQGETLAIIGPNGAGKSTLLLTLSQLLIPEKGEILFLGKSFKDLDQLAYRRKIALVFQIPLLLNGTVFDNIATGLRFRKTTKIDIENRVDTWLNNFSIPHLRNRSTQRLSGGEAQRVSLARAFALEPDILFLDEPFSSLDTPTRTQLIQDLQDLLKKTNRTTIFVTHDMDEAILLGDRVAVLLNGSIRQHGPPEKVFSAPVDPEVARFVGIETIIAGKVVHKTEGLVQIDTSKGLIEVVGDARINQEVFICLRSEDITLFTDGKSGISSARNRFQGKITRLMPQGPLVKVVIDCGFLITALITTRSSNQMGLAVGKQVSAAFKASAGHLILR